MAKKPKLQTVVNNTGTTREPAQPISKPPKFDLSKFKSKKMATVAGVETLQNALPHYSIADAGDFVRLHHDQEKYWSDELCFVNVPIPGQKRDTLHLIDEDLAMKYLPSGKILRFSLALASKPNDVFFLCHVPTQNPDNSWNKTNLDACERARTAWVEATSRRKEGVDEYKITFSHDHDAFPEPKWPTQSLDELIESAFNNDRIIDREDHPALLRLIGAKQSMS